jgi:hypothetical protein
MRIDTHAIGINNKSQKITPADIHQGAEHSAPQKETWQISSKFLQINSQYTIEQIFEVTYALQNIL